MILFKIMLAPSAPRLSPGRRLDSACRPVPGGGLRGATKACLRPDGYQPMPDVNGNSALAAPVPAAPLSLASVAGREGKPVNRLLPVPTFPPVNAESLSLRRQTGIARSQLQGSQQSCFHQNFFLASSK
ncbi:hypothetical protein ACVPTE_23115 [Salmonella enterica subsp. enterica serovar Winslow]|nr:hypothetical protein [Salmonella enterica subsp. enterica serovar Menston]